MCSILTGQTIIESIFIFIILCFISKYILHCVKKVSIFDKLLINLYTKEFA